MINVYLNYYRDMDNARALELDFCLRRLDENRAIGNLHILAQHTPNVSGPNTHVVSDSERATFGRLFSMINESSGDDDVNAVLNSDCFFLEEDAGAIERIGRDEAYCILRVDIVSANPLKIDKGKTRRLHKKHASDCHDCWIIRGRPKKNMRLDFYPGTPGCDNRLAYELQNAGYRILNPCSSIKIYHFHRSNLRRLGEAHRIGPPYAFPELV